MQNKQLSEKTLLKQLGFNQRLLIAISQTAISNPDTMCLVDRVRITNQPVSPAAARSINNRDLLKAFTAAGIYNLVLVNRNKTSWSFVAKMADGNIISSEIDRHVKPTLLQATGTAILDIVNQKKKPSPFTDNDSVTDVIYPDAPVFGGGAVGGEGATSTYAWGGLKASIGTNDVEDAPEFIKSMQEQRALDARPAITPFSAMPPGLAEAILAAGIEPVRIGEDGRAAEESAIDVVSEVIEN